MSKNNGSQGGDNVVQLSTNCSVEKCGNKTHKMTFCAEHFMWFKEGLISRQGQRPSDFDKKYQAFMTRTKKAA